MFLCRPRPGVRPPGAVATRRRVSLGRITSSTTPRASAAWQHTEGDFALEAYPDGHFFLTDHVAAILTLIRAELTRSVPSRRR